MTTLLYQVTLANEDSIPADAAVNTWHSSSDSADRLDDSDTFAGLLIGFYASSVSFLSPALSGDITVKVYDLIDPKPRAPIATYTDTITIPGGTPLPNELAVCLSYHASIASGISIGRRRGRIYIGPLNTDAMVGGTNDCRVHGDLTALLASLGASLMGAGSAPTFKWSVFSPTTAGAEPWTLGDLVAGTGTVIGGHCDNAFDIMRSRGTPADARVTWP